MLLKMLLLKLSDDKGKRKIIDGNRYFPENWDKMLIMQKPN